MSTTKRLKACEVCGAQGSEYPANSPVEHIYCNQHAAEDGYCWFCGYRWPGQLSKGGCCPECESDWRINEPRESNE